MFYFEFVIIVYIYIYTQKGYISPKKEGSAFIYLLTLMSF